MSGGDPEVAPEWTRWLAENALRGAPRDALVAVLVERGIDGGTARGIVDGVLDSPILAGARAVAGRAAGVEQAARLRRHFEGLRELEVDGELSDERFFAEAWTAHRPVVLRGAAAGWARWTLAELGARYGDAEIEVLRGRSSHPRWWTIRERLCARVPFRDLLALMEGPPTDDVYGVARNDLLKDLPELAEDIGRMPGVAGRDKHARLWVGPAGTFTPLHHDQSSAWLVQRVGRKRVWLASPLEPALIEAADGVFSTMDARDPPEGERAEIRWWEVVLHPDDAVFLPAGWWHQVLAETASVSVSLGRFRWPNDLTWYAPARYAAD